MNPTHVLKHNKMKKKKYSRRQVLNILKKWDKESKETYSYADCVGLTKWFEKKIK